jgi:hypothetical protein
LAGSGYKQGKPGSKKSASASFSGNGGAKFPVKRGYSGQSNKEIADSAHLSVAMVKKHSRDLPQARGALPQQARRANALNPPKRRFTQTTINCVRK